METDRLPKETSTPKSLCQSADPANLSTRVRAATRAVATNPRQINFELAKRMEQLYGWLAEPEHDLSCGCFHVHLDHPKTGKQPTWDIGGGGRVGHGEATVWPSD